MGDKGVLCQHDLRHYLPCQCWTEDKKRIAELEAENVRLSAQLTALIEMEKRQNIACAKAEARLEIARAALKHAEGTHGCKVASEALHGTTT